MRKLSKSQKKILKDYACSGYFDDDLLINKYNNRAILMQQLENKNDYETLYQDVNRLIEDLYMADTLQEKIAKIDAQ